MYDKLGITFKEFSSAEFVHEFQYDYNFRHCHFLSGYMRKFCLESGCTEPSERAINQTFSHQVNYARRRTRAVKEPGRISTTSKKRRRDQMKAPDKYLQI